jgi:uncharacterized membrane protein YidH (DUF202 family)
LTDQPAFDRSLSGERTALAWTRSALSLAANGALIARAAFVASLPVLGVVLTVAIAAATLLIWRHGQLITPARRRPLPGPHAQTHPLRQLSALTVATAAVAAAVAVIS